MEFSGAQYGSSDQTPADLAYDGGRGLATGGLASLLDDTRATLGATLALVLRRTRSNELCAIAASADEQIRLPLRDEPLVWHCDAGGNALPAPIPSAVTDITLRSHQRPYRLQLTAAITIPLAAASGWLLIGEPATRGGRLIDLQTAAACGRWIERAGSTSPQRGSLATYRDLLSALKTIGRAELEAEALDDVFDAIVIAAAELFGSSVAYVALPEPDRQHFTFTNLIGVRTGEFRRLRMRIDQGLGGLARTERRAIRTLDYGNDPRFRSAPVSETRGEGIVSAMSAPLIIDGGIAATIYVGNRRATRFTETDLALLDAFADTAAVGLSRHQTEEHRIAVMRRHEQERLALSVHDSVVRSLMQIGFQAQEGLRDAADSDMRNRLAQIGDAAQSCLQSLRATLAGSASSSLDHDTSIGEIIETLRAAHRRAHVLRTFDMCNADRSTELPARVAHAIERIAQEALMNAELHSNCSTERVLIELDDGRVTVEITDDGDGISPTALARLGSETTTHFGVRAMRAAAAELGGQLSVCHSEPHGVAVRATLPVPAAP